MKAYCPSVDTKAHNLLLSDVRLDDGNLLAGLIIIIASAW